MSRQFTMDDVKILHEDNSVLVVVKPQNIPSQGDSSGDVDLLSLLKQYIKEKYNKPGNVYLGLVHRLDRPVGGLMVFARTSKAAARLSAQMREHEAGREYLCVADGPVRDRFTLINFVQENKRLGRMEVCDADERGAKQAILNGWRRGSRNGLNLCEIRLETGRKHQIRVQMREMGAPLWGDHRYGRGVHGQQIALWGYRLTIEHPTTPNVMTFQDLPCGSVWNSYGAELTDMAIRFANSAATILKPEEQPAPVEPENTDLTPDGGA